jgi:translation initiation factor 1
MAKKNEREGVVYSTDSHFAYSTANAHSEATLEPGKQNLRVWLERNKGKVATVVKGFVGTDEDLEALGKKLKQACGVGGTAKNGEATVQGDHREKVIALLSAWGYPAKKAGG